MTSEPSSKDGLSTDPRMLESRARAMKGDDAREAWSVAAKAWRERGLERAFPASRYLDCARRGGADPALLSAEADELVARFLDDDWLRSHRAWIRVDAARAAAAGNAAASAARCADEALEDLERVKNPAYLAVAALSVLRKAASDEDGARPEAAREAHAAVLSVLVARADSLMEALPKCARDDDGVAPLALFFYLARRLAKAAGDADSLDRFMGPAVERYPDDEWFAEAHVRAAGMLGDPAEALRRAARHRKRLPGSWALAAAAAEALAEVGDVAAATATLRAACLSSKVPWPWARLASLLSDTGDVEGAARALACGLSFHRRSDADKVWKLHFSRAGHLHALGRDEEAAVELFLSIESRRLGGWEPQGAQFSLAGGLSPTACDLLFALEREPLGQVRRRAMDGWREQAAAAVREAAIKAKVSRYDESRGFGFVELDDGRTAFLHRSKVGRRACRPGGRARVVVTESFDRKKNRPGLEVNWIEFDDAQAMPGPAKAVASEADGGVEETRSEKTAS